MQENQQEARPPSPAEKRFRKIQNLYNQLLIETSVLLVHANPYLVASMNNLDQESTAELRTAIQNTPSLMLEKSMEFFYSSETIDRLLKSTRPNAQIASDFMIPTTGLQVGLFYHHLRCALGAETTDTIEDHAFTKSQEWLLEKLGIPLPSSIKQNVARQIAISGGTTELSDGRLGTEYLLPSTLDDAGGTLIHVLYTNNAAFPSNFVLSIMPI